MWPVGLLIIYIMPYLDKLLNYVYAYADHKSEIHDTWGKEHWINGQRPSDMYSNLFLRISWVNHGNSEYECQRSASRCLVLYTLSQCSDIT